MFFFLYGYVHITCWNGPNPIFLACSDSDLIFFKEVWTNQMRFFPNQIRATLICGSRSDSYPICNSVATVTTLWFEFVFFVTSVHIHNLPVIISQCWHLTIKKNRGKHQQRQEEWRDKEFHMCFVIWLLHKLLVVAGSMRLTNMIVNHQISV